MGMPDEGLGRNIIDLTVLLNYHSDTLRQIGGVCQGKDSREEKRPHGEGDGRPSHAGGLRVPRMTAGIGTKNLKGRPNVGSVAVVGRRFSGAEGLRETEVEDLD